MAEGADTMGHAMAWGGREWTTMDITTLVRGSKTAVFKGVWTAMDVHGREIGGEGGIRTLGARKGTPHFECGTIDHSATSPQKTSLAGR